jgi:YVTN family beta-propeller protein
MKHNLILFLALCLTAVSSAETSFLAPCDIDWAVNSATVFVTASAGQRVLVVDADKQCVTQSFAFPARLSGLTQGKSGLLYVTGGGAQGRVFIADPETGAIQRTIPVGHTPAAPVLSADEKTLYVCNQFDNDVSVIDLETGRTIQRVPVVREPVAAILSPDEKQLFVANLLPDGRSDTANNSAHISVIQTDGFLHTTIPLVTGSESIRGLAVSPDGRYLFATHFVARNFVSVTQLDRGWVSTDGLSVIRISDQTLLHTILLDDTARGFPNPWAIGFTGPEDSLVVSAAGSHELSLIKIDQLLEYVQTLDNSRTLYNDISLISAFCQRISLNGNGPRAIATQKNRAIVAHYFSDTLDFVSLDDPQNPVVSSLELAPGQKTSPARRGEMLFNDATLSLQHWISCATCHPDGRTDGLNWDLVNDGLGNPKNAKSLLMMHATPSYMWMAVDDDFFSVIKEEIRTVLLAQIPDADVRAIMAYLAAMKPVPSPYLINGKPSKSAKRGQKLFKKAGCVYCHPKPLYTSLDTQLLDTFNGRDAGQPIDTPTLIEIWRTAPYLHDGSALTLEEVIRRNHSNGARLTESQISDLANFLRTL